ncbi:hypothetical protein Z946_855 [Sulfitobacter noctilucicola]|nr:DUF1127 domain-containing protein [Sulfitobacter noctilucicola]KIN61999.1 hypothetical protein Z946_855 [Sulfitobacter noctilucicola]
MAFNSHIAETGSNASGSSLSAIFDFIKALPRKVASQVRAGTRAMQQARMIGILSSMTDAQLAQVGITRAEIPQHALKMLSDGFGEPEQ